MAHSICSFAGLSVLNNFFRYSGLPNHPRIFLTFHENCQDLLTGHIVSETAKNRQLLDISINVSSRVTIIWGGKRHSNQPNHRSMLPSGSVSYSLGTPPVIGRGLSWSEKETEAAVKGPVAKVVYDDAGFKALTSLLSGLPDTGFTSSNLRVTLSQPAPVESWRVGEALAESYLTHHRACHFPWPDGRDIRKSGSSLPGADLVGFQQHGNDHRFTFGEVKTSSDKEYPPSACYGITGLKQQLEDLRDNLGIRDDLVRYLGHRAASGAAWKNQFITAAGRYFADKNDVRVFGLLVRDVPPNEDDVRVRVSALAKGCPPQMTIEVLAIYLPEKSIAKLSSLAAQSRKGDGS